MASTNSTSQPIPILPPPPAPLSLGPSRARRQLAARLAKQKAQAAENGENDGEEKDHGSEHSNPQGTDVQWHTNPFVIAGLDDDADGQSSPAGAAFPSTDLSKDAPFSSPPFAESGFSPPDSLSSNSSDDGEDGSGRVRGKERAPLEVDDDDDDMGEMVGPSGGSGMIDSSDEEDEAIMNESLGYPDLGAERYKNFRRSRAGASPFDDDDDHQNDSSDGEDDGLVEILVPGRKP
ncbi:hypothetical protein BDW42DRAFT_11261 [Aspergillus taichungensis]|uniref:Uncharacterized protein n=1 Tax=Aspergillus taichungensis TaxID=482145 RepID=A0A2J5I5I8_9EURO|nr:hypothetical protein BDW42DRAFT_11261 [Aspergillus taichungensis]